MSAGSRRRCGGQTGRGIRLHGDHDLVGHVHTPMLVSELEAQRPRRRRPMTATPEDRGGSKDAAYDPGATDDLVLLHEAERFGPR